MSRNLIITQRHGNDRHGTHFDSLESAYVDCLSSFGFRVIPIPATTPDFDLFVAKLSPCAIVLSGGGDVDPQLYGGLTTARLSLSVERDRLEASLIQFAVREKVPLLGICRGMQMINVFFGGALDGTTLPATYADQDLLTPHSVQFDACSLQKQFPEGCEVNSYHRQAVALDRIGNGLVFFARHTTLPLAEGIRHTCLPIAGIQWHPERNQVITPLDRLLLEAFRDRQLFWEVSH